MENSETNQKWRYPIAQDYGLGDEDNGTNNIPIFMIRMMLRIKATASGDNYETYKYAFRKTAEYYYTQSAINIMKGYLEHGSKFSELETKARKKTIEMGEIDRVTKDFNAWVKAATKTRNSQRA
jgi:hypothetical protein